VRIATAYRLPFAFGFSALPLWGAGVLTTVKLTLRAGLDVEATRPAMQMKLMTFGVLCATGALGQVPPEGFEPVTPLFDSARVFGRTLEWILPQWPAATDSLPVLASLYAAEDVSADLERIDLSARGEPTIFTLEHENNPARAYPGVRPMPGFHWKIDNAGEEDMRVLLRPLRIPSASLRAEIEKVLLLWAHAASSGAYGVAPVEPLKCSFGFEPQVDWFDGYMAWHLKRFRAHPDALDGLVNVVAAMHERLCPMAECLIG
jgi:hypothetical protein